MRYRKTPAGLALVAARSHDIDHRLRSLLVIINPSLMGSTVEQMLAALRLPLDALQALIQRGLIEPLPEREQSADARQASEPVGIDLSNAEFEQYRSAVGLISDISSRYLGWRAFPFQLKIERASSIADIRTLTGEIDELLRKVKKVEESAGEMAALKLLLN